MVEIAGIVLAVFSVAFTYFFKQPVKCAVVVPQEVIVNVSTQTTNGTP